MQTIYSNVTKLMVETRQGSNMLYLPLDKIMQLSAQDSSQLPTNGTPAAPAPLSPAVPSVDNRSRDASRSRDRDTR
jgi:membrane protease subunit HflK